MDANQVKAIITGGASGLGLAAARRIVADGGKVALFDVNAERGAEAVAELGDAASFHLADVTDEAGIVACVEAAQAAMGGLNAVLNCAGVLGAGRVLGKHGPMPLSTFETTIRINLVGSFNVAKAAAARIQHEPAGADGERGVIIHTASIAAWEGQVGQAAYAASKGGILGLTLPMARELARFGIRVLTIAPGVFMTPMAGGMPDAVRQSLEAQIPFPSRLGDPAEFADAIAFALRNRFLNGTALRLDGSMRMV